MKLLFLTLLLLTSAVSRAEPLLEYDGRKIEFKDLPASAQQSIYDIDYRSFKAKENTLQQEVVLQLYFEDEAKKQKKSVADVQKAELEVKEPSDKDTKDFYEKNKARIPYPYDKVKDEIKKLVQNERTEEQKVKLLEKVTKKKNVKLFITEPEAPQLSLSVDGFPRKGKAGANVQIIEFADYQCPHCKHAAEVFKKVLPKYLDRLEYVYVDFPINPSGVSKVVAQGSHCADQQGKFWEYHYMAFDRQATLTTAAPQAFAKELKLDEDKFKKCMEDKASMAMVERGKNEGERIGVNGTPAIFLNGRRANIGHDEDVLKKELDKVFKTAS